MSTPTKRPLSFGEQMAEAHNKWHTCQPLTDDEACSLHVWLGDVADYMSDMHQGWTAVYLHSEKEAMARILEARGLRKL